MPTLTEQLGASGESRPRTAREAEAVLPWPALLAIVVLIGVLPVLLIFGGQTGLARYLYPALAFLVGVYLVQASPPHYLGLCLWLFVATPFVRRLADYEAGWQHVSPIMLAPFLVTALAVLPAAKHLLLDSRGPRDWPFALVFVSVAYGLLVAVLYGRLASGVFEALRWAAPPCVALFILHHADQAKAMGRVVTRAFSVALPLVGLYGIAQYFLVPPWDGYWMRNAPITSIGHPYPFEVRIFATMNSPLSLTTALTTGMLLLAAQPSFGIALRALPAFSALLLTVIRTAWGGFLVGLVWLFALGSAGLRLKLLFTVLVLAFGVATLLTTVPEVNRMLVERFEMTGSLEADESARSRLRQYAVFPNMLDKWLFGRGLGWAGTYGHLDAQENIVFDSGLIDVMLSLGVVGGTVYLIGAGVCCARLLRQAGARHEPLLRGSAAALACGAAQMPLGPMQQGELGFFIWMALGLGLALLSNSRTPQGPEP